MKHLLLGLAAGYLGTCAAVRLRHPAGYVACSPVLTQRAYEMLDHFGRLATERGLTWWAEAGTLLGAVREGRLLPWDGDVDLAIPEGEAAGLLDLAPRLEESGLELRPTSFGMKVGWRADRYPHATRSARLARTFVRNDHPYVDIFFRADHGDRFLFSRPYPQGMWPEQSLMRKEELFPLARYPFGPLSIPGPRNPEPYLERAYGDWRTPVYTVPYNAPGLYRTFGLFLKKRG